MPEAKVRSVGLGYEYEPMAGVRFRMRSPRKHDGGLRAVIIVDSELPGSSGRIARGDVIFDGAGSKRDFTRALTDNSGNGSLPWRAWLEGLCDAVSESYGSEPSVEAGQDAEPDEMSTCLADPLILQDAPNYLFGPYSGGKGFVACGLAVALAGNISSFGPIMLKGRGAVLYCDWESTRRAFDARLWAISRGMGLDRPPRGIWYKRLRGPMADQVELIAEETEEHDCVLVVVDSAGMAIGASSGERIEDGAIRLFEGLRCLGRTVLVTDHVSAELSNNKLAGKAIGSQYKMALSRQAWEIRKEQIIGSNSFTVGLYQAKPPENAPMHEPIGLKFTFLGGMVEVTAASAGDRLSLLDRIAQVIAVHPHTLDELLMLFPADDTEDKKEVAKQRAVLRARLHEGKGKGLFEETSRGWLLVRSEVDRYERMADQMEAELNAIPF